jgi:quinol monooxygenase YgiN
MSSHVKISGILTAREGKAHTLAALLQDMAPDCRAEPGNLRWDIWEDQAQAGRYILDELYVDADAAAAHHETPHYRNYLSRALELADRVAYVLSPSRVESEDA